VRTPFGGIVDLLALDSQGDLVIIELKRDRTPRDIVAQVLDYGAWAKDLKAEDIARLFDEYQQKAKPGSERQSLDQAFTRRFHVKAMPDELNEKHELVIVASSLDPTTERVVTYLLNHHGVRINAVFFRVFQDEGREYLARVWLQDPFKAEAEPPEGAVRGEWNGEFYASFGGDRSWEDAVKYGFFGGGGGRWYSDTLQLLEPGARIWVNRPGVGYLGVGVVEEPVMPCEAFVVTGEKGERVPLLTVAPSGRKMKRSTDDPDQAEYLVRVKWLKTVTESHAIKEKGFFGNQNTVARPTSEKWKHTVERLKARLAVS
jgi:hypothetical protein